MGVEIMLIFLGVTLFAGMFLGGIFSYMEKEAEQTQEIRVHAPVAEPSFFGKPAMAHEIALRQIEHHLRQEIKVANLFVDQPSVETLWLGRQTTMEVA